MEVAERLLSGFSSEAPDNLDHREGEKDRFSITEEFIYDPGHSTCEISLNSHKIPIRKWQSSNQEICLRPHILQVQVTSRDLKPGRTFGFCSNCP